LTPAIEILYVGARRQDDEVDDIVRRGGVVHEARSVFDGIARLKRTTVGAALVELAALAPNPPRAVEALRGAAGARPLLVSMTADEWEELRPKGFLGPEEVLLRPYYPDELWRRVAQAVLPPPSRAVAHFRSDADRLSALIDDAHRLNRFTNNLRALANHFVAIVEGRVRAGRVSLFLGGRDKEELTVIEATGLPAEAREQAMVRLGEGVAGEAAAARRVVLVREAGADGPGSERGYAGGSYMIAPLVHEGEVLGVLCVSERYEAGPFNPGDLEYLEAFAEMAGQILANAIQYRTADELAVVDELTQLYNKRYFRRALQQEVERAIRYKHDLTLAILDIDHFKRFNDTQGHAAGDEALARVAEILRQSFRKVDIVVRYGGEEFAVIMPETSRKEGNGVGFVDRARKLVEAANIDFLDEQGVRRPLTLSGGVATLPLQADTAEDLFEKADQALYRAKARGRNVIVGY